MIPLYTEQDDVRLYTSSIAYPSGYKYLCINMYTLKTSKLALIDSGRSNLFGKTSILQTHKGMK